VERGGKVAKYLVKRLLSTIAVLLLPLFPGWAGEIHEAIIKDQTEKALELLQGDHDFIKARDKSDCTPLHYAAQYNRPEVAKWLIKHKAEINAIDQEERTPLDLTTDGEMAKLLIKAGADLKRKNASGRTPLQQAAFLKRTDVCEAILASGYPLDLTSALTLGKRVLAMKIIEHKPAEARDTGPPWDHWGCATPLGIAAGQGDLEMVKLLLKAGAPVNGGTEGPDGKMTPLCNAVWGGHNEVAAVLCAAGADCNVTGGKHLPHLLDFAVKHSDPKMTDLLTQYGAKPGEEK
jgi:hypothetical protein